MKLARLGERGGESPVAVADDAMSRPGDVVELEIDGLGRRRHEMVAA